MTIEEKKVNSVFQIVNKASIPQASKQGHNKLLDSKKLIADITLLLNELSNDDALKLTASDVFKEYGLSENPIIKPSVYPTYKIKEILDNHFKQNGLNFLVTGHEHKKGILCGFITIEKA